MRDYQPSAGALKGFKILILRLGSGQGQGSVGVGCLRLVRVGPQSGAVPSMSFRPTRPADERAHCLSGTEQAQPLGPRLAITTSMTLLSSAVALQPPSPQLSPATRPDDATAGISQIRMKKAQCPRSGL